MSNEISYEWEVQGFYAGYWECLTTEDTKDEAVFQKQCYDENECGVPHRIKRVRVQIVDINYSSIEQDDWNYEGDYMTLADSEGERK